MASGEIIGFKKNPSSLYLDNRKKMLWRHLREWPCPANCRSGSWKRSFIRRNFLWEENALKLPCVPEMPRRLLLCYSSYRGQAKLTSGCFSHSPKQEATGQAGSRPWHGSCEACVDMQSYKAMETSTHISTAGLEGQAACNGIGVLGDSSWEGNVWSCEDEAYAAVEVPGPWKGCQEKLQTRQ